MPKPRLIPRELTKDDESSLVDLAIAWSAKLIIQKQGKRTLYLEFRSNTVAV